MDTHKTTKEITKTEKLTVLLKKKKILKLVIPLLAVY